MGKKKPISGKSAHSHNSKGINAKKHMRNGKPQGAASTSRPADGETVTYGVVPSEYNIQAQINWLTAPPSTNDKRSANPAPPPLFKKPHRGYHKDVCEACGEGECLMYCDKCPVAFHAICDDPPLPPEDYEEIGVDWKCKKCRFMDTLHSEDAMLPQSLDAGCTNGRKGVISAFFGSVIQSLAAQNPVEFKLSKEYPAYIYPFPGTSRHTLKVGRTRTSVVELENGMVPKPTALCFHCQRSCRTGALIQCDKCDIYFHLDCLNPPLTTIPTSIWHCPAHAEPYLESKVLISTALSERIKIWDSCAKPVNTHAVILKFMAKASKRNPPFRYKRPISMMPNIDVPMSVRSASDGDVSYINERFGMLQTLATVCEMERTQLEMDEFVEKFQREIFEEKLPAMKFCIEQRSKIECLKFSNNLKLSFLRRLMNEGDPEITKSAEQSEIDVARSSKIGRLDNQEASNENVTEASTSISQANLNCKNSLLDKPSTSENSDRDSAKSEHDTENVGDPDVISGISRASSEQSQRLTSNLGVMKTLSDNFSVEEEKWIRKIVEDEKESTLHDMAVIDELDKKLQNMDKRSRFITSKDFSVPSLESNSNSLHLANGCPSVGVTQVPTTSSVAKDSQKESTLLQFDTIKGIPKKLINKLAARHLKHLIRKKEVKEKANQERSRLTLKIGALPHPLALLHIDNTGITVEIAQRSFWIGSGHSSDCKLTDFVKCNRIDEKHAKMYYNSHEKCWEILNYSAQGIYVNNMLYGFKSLEVPLVGTTALSTERLAELQDISVKRLDDYIKRNSADIPEIDFNPCYCKPFPTKSLATVFEGSAKLYPGSKILMGCASILVEDLTFLLGATT